MFEASSSSGEISSHNLLSSPSLLLVWKGRQSSSTSFTLVGHRHSPPAALHRHLLWAELAGGICWETTPEWLVLEKVCHISQLMYTIHKDIISTPPFTSSPILSSASSFLWPGQNRSHSPTHQTKSCSYPLSRNSPALSYIIIPRTTHPQNVQNSNMCSIPSKKRYLRKCQ